MDDGGDCHDSDRDAEVADADGEILQRQDNFWHSTCGWTERVSLAIYWVLCSGLQALPDAKIPAAISAEVAPATVRSSRAAGHYHPSPSLTPPALRSNFTASYAGSRPHARGPPNGRATLVGVGLPSLPVVPWK